MSFYLRSGSEKSLQKLSTLQRNFYEKLDYIRQLHYTKINYQFCCHFAGKKLTYSWMCYNSGGLVPPQQLQSFEPQHIAILPDEITIAIVIVCYYSKTNFELKMLVTI